MNVVLVSAGAPEERLGPGRSAFVHVVEHDRRPTIAGGGGPVEDHLGIAAALQ